MADYDISVRPVFYVDNDLAVRCDDIVGEFIGQKHVFANSIKSDVNLRRCPMFVAEMGPDNVCGFVVGDARIGRVGTGQIKYLFVTGPMHNRGVGTRLLSQIENAMQSVGVGRLSVCARPWAVPFYMSRGYVRDHVQKNFLQKNL